MISFLLCKGCRVCRRLLSPLPLWLCPIPCRVYVFFRENLPPSSLGPGSLPVPAVPLLSVGVAGSGGGRSRRDAAAGSREAEHAQVLSPRAGQDRRRYCCKQLHYVGCAPKLRRLCCIPAADGSGQSARVFGASSSLLWSSLGCDLARFHSPRGDGFHSPVVMAFTVPWWVCSARVPCGPVSEVCDGLCRTCLKNQSRSLTDCCASLVPCGTLQTVVCWFPRPRSGWCPGSHGVWQLSNEKPVQPQEHDKCGK